MRIEELTARGFSSHLKWDWLKSEGVWRWSDFASTGSLLTPGRRGAFLPISKFPGSWFSLSCLERRGSDWSLTGFGFAIILLCSFFILCWKKITNAIWEYYHYFQNTRSCVWTGCSWKYELPDQVYKSDKTSLSFFITSVFVPQTHFSLYN